MTKLTKEQVDKFLELLNEVPLPAVEKFWKAVTFIYVTKAQLEYGAPFPDKNSLFTSEADKFYLEQRKARW